MYPFTSSQENQDKKNESLSIVPWGNEDDMMSRLEQNNIPHEIFSMLE